MDSRRFLGLRQSHNPYRWSMEVTKPLSTWGGFLFGGCGLGAAIAAMEDTSDRQCIWATAQYLSYARPGEVVDIDVNVAVSGHQITQARAVCHVGNREILTVNAALGHRPFEHAGQWERMPEVPPPLECRPRLNRFPQAGTINEQLEQRLAKGRDLEDLDRSPGDGQVLMWMRVPEQFNSLDASFLAVMGDWVPFGVGQSLGIHGSGNSLDNTLRVVQVVPTEWVLLDIRVHAAQRGFGHGLVHMYAQDGTLLATASQSCILRMWNLDPAIGEDGSVPQGEEPT
jgi:acyl-CoA thioesterase II